MLWMVLAACTRTPPEPADSAADTGGDAPAGCVSEDLQAAIDAGGTVTICEGTYTLDLVAGREVALVGERVTIVGEVAATAPFSMTGIAVQGIVTLAADTTLSDVDVTGWIAARGFARLDLADVSIRDGAGLSLVDVGEVAFAGVEISGNTAEEGGGIYASGVTSITGDAVVSFNTATRGGGLYWLGDGTLSGLTLRDNDAEEGGGAWLSGASYSFDVTMDDNAATTGGGLYVEAEGDLSLSGAVATENVAETGGGVAIVAGGAVALSALTVEGNDATAAAGIYVLATSVLLTDTTVSSNAATGSGGGVRADVGAVQLERTTLSANAAEHGAGLLWAVPDGGGWLVADEDSALIGNDASGWGGGAIAWYEGASAGVLDVEGLVATGNEASVGGGLALYQDPDRLGTLTVTVRDAVATSNVATWLGGGAFVTVADTVDLVGCHFDANDGADGGGLFLLGEADALVRFSDTRVDGNDAVTGGGVGVDAFSPVTLTLQGLVASGNTAEDGGGLALFYEDVPVSLVLVDATLASNGATEAGGGVWAWVDGAFELQNTWITGNTAASGGGLGVEARGAGPAITADSATVVTGNTAAEGGGLWLDLASDEASWVATVAGLRLDGNEATSGGGLATTGGAVTLASCSVVSNAAESGGGAWLGGTLTSDASDWGEGDDDNAPDDIAGVETRWGEGSSFVCGAGGCE